ncbi:hypothetical protein [Streptomyces sp. NPDC005141]
MSEADLAVDSGQALPDLGDTGRAHRLITEGEQLLPAARDKTRGVFLTYQAASHLDQKEPEPAAAAATQSLLLARRIGAPRCTSLVEALLPRSMSRSAPAGHACGVYQESGVVRLLGLQVLRWADRLTLVRR